MIRRLLVDARLPLGSGIGRYIRSLLPPVAARLPHVEIDMFVQQGEVTRAVDTLADSSNVRVIGSDIAPFTLEEQLRLPRMAQHYDATWFTSYWLPLRWSGRMAVTVHDVLHLESALAPMSRAKRAAARLGFAKVRRSADEIMFDSRFTQRRFVELVGEPRNSSVVHLGVDHLAVREAHRRDRRVVVIAAPKFHKNLELLIDAWTACSTEGWRLTIVSPGDAIHTATPVLEQAAAIPGIDVMSGISDLALANLLGAAAIVAVPSRYEGFGFPLLEGMVAGAQCISSTAGSLVEIASGAYVSFVAATDRPGWTQALAAEIGRFDRADPNLPDHAAHNRGLAAGFTWARAADLTAAVLTRVVQ